MLKLDCCAEERQRLNVEAENLSQWFYRELVSIELALNEPQSK